MSIAEDGREYLSSITLMVVGELLDPGLVSQELEMTPSECWRKGDKKKVGESHHEWGGWKKFLPEAVKAKSFELQLQYWVVELNSKASVLSQLCMSGNRCLLDCFITTEATASLLLSAKLQQQVAALGAEIQVSIWAGTNAG